ncbi:MAG: tRNA pseudouridine(55) synthase TruB [Candidatus Magasanikbacteria bacterium]|nr:tRNA pseudouridine(55) synthase TruB [Candidatus Magasanikbacteria bacterium]
MSFLLISKQSGWTSLDVVAKLRGIFHIEKIGHAGTLDPFATGLLIVGIGRESTKRLEEFKNFEKEYEVDLKFGFTSSTYDCDGEITAQPHVRAIERTELAKVLEKYQGHIQQIPPMHSAKKVNGVRLHKLARKGIVVERKPADITIFNLEILESNSDTAKLRVVCSPGTYIRSLVHDIGQDLQVGAYVTALNRTRIGDYKVIEAHTLDEVSAQRELFIER